MAERSEAKNAKRSFASKIKKMKYYDAKLRFALLASLRSAIFCETELDKKLVTIPARVNQNYEFHKKKTFLHQQKPHPLVFLCFEKAAITASVVYT